MAPDTTQVRALLGRYPIIAVAPVAWLWVLTDRIDVVAYCVSVALLLLSLVVETVRARRRRRGPFSGVPSALAFLAAVGVLRHAGGGLSSGVGALALVPVFQVALFGRDRRELWVLLAAEAALYLAPILLVGGAAYPHTQYRAGVIFVLVSGVVALAGRRLVTRVRLEAAAARSSRRMLEEVTALAHELFSSHDLRGDLSAGTLRIAGASLTMLLEPDADGATLRQTAIAGLSLASLELPINPESSLGAAFLSGRPFLVSDVDERALSAPEVWRAIGCPHSLLYEPLMRGGEAIGVLVVTWQDGDALTPARLSAVELLAHEAAIALGRADQVTQLTGMAQTDPLTGLPNRRAWDDRVASALRDDREITVALLDIDHFKAYNDAHGHPAGDRLLRESAAAWRDLLRGGDILARLGGEEFGVLLLDCAPDMAVEVTERLRAATAGGETCSAGLATRRPGEPFESVVARADRALYEAKAAGRDLARSAA